MAHRNIYVVHVYERGNAALALLALLLLLLLLPPTNDCLPVGSSTVAAPSGGVLALPDRLAKFELLEPPTLPDSADFRRCISSARSAPVPNRQIFM
jgi:hypothetical protein